MPKSLDKSKGKLFPSRAPSIQEAKKADSAGKATLEKIVSNEPEGEKKPGSSKRVPKKKKTSIEGGNIFYYCYYYHYYYYYYYCHYYFYYYNCYCGYG